MYGKHLNRDTDQRTALFKSLVRSLILSEKIQTTDAKAKAIKGMVDKLVTQAKSPTTRRLIAQFITDKTVAEKFISDIVPRLSDRTSGYTSIVKIGKRLGDGAMMVQMSLLTQGQKSTTKEVKKATKQSALPQATAEPKVKTEKPKRAVREAKK